MKMIYLPFLLDLPLCLLMSRFDGTIYASVTLQQLHTDSPVSIEDSDFQDNTASLSEKFPGKHLTAFQ